MKKIDAQKLIDNKEIELYKDKPKEGEFFGYIGDINFVIPKIYNKDTNFEEEIKEGKVIVDFFATWCGPCRMIGNVLEEISKEQEDIKILKIDVDEYDELAYQFQVMSIPTIVFYKDGKIINKKVGFCNKKELLGYFN